MKKLRYAALLTVMLLLCSSVLAGCGSGETGGDADMTIGQTLLENFKTEASSDKDPASLAEKLCTDTVFGEVMMMSQPVEEGMLNGFNEEIKGFKSGAVFSPAIGTIPFIGYVFESDDPEALAGDLKAKAQLNWNVCTEASETVCETYDGLVFFCMAPETFDEQQ